MIFPSVELEAVVQVDDKTRLNAEKSFVSVDEAAITLIEVEPEAAAGFIDVTTTKYLDWQYATDGTKVVSVRVTTDGAPITAIRSIEVLTAADDKLFSSDADIIGYEPEVLDYTRQGKNSFLDIHRVSQTRILAWLDEHRIHDTQGNKLTKAAIIDLEEVAQWSRYMTLRIIYEGLSNAIDDIFHDKSMRYKALEAEARNRGAIKLDLDGDGEIDSREQMDLRSLRLVRR